MSDRAIKIVRKMIQPDAIAYKVESLIQAAGNILVSERLRDKNSPEDSCRGTKKKGAFIIMSNQELEKKICELKSFEQMAKDLEVEIEALKDEIKAEMTEQGVDKLSTNMFNVYWNRYDTKRFDAKAFKATHAELYEQYCKTTATRRFMLS